jgi:eukaryotic-like serine/threonine-protein kinase
MSHGPCRLARVLGTAFGHYRIVSRLGSGGMGDVYRARDERLDRDVALKLLPHEFTDDPDRLARFEREARLLASLNHPGIAAIYGLEPFDRQQCLVLELVEGENLAARLARGPIPLEEGLPLALQIADALEAAHERGVIHRDLKPANIMVDANGRAKLLDFGLAKAADDQPPAQSNVMNSPTMAAMATQAGMVIGTAPYMSPEQARGKLVDRRTDIWSFGCVLFEMFSGTAPFKGTDVTEILSAIIQLDPDHTCLPADLPLELRRLIERCLRKNPRRRLQHIGDARAALEDLIQNPEPQPQPQPTARRASRVLLATGWGLSAVLAAALAATFFATGTRNAADIPTRRFAIDLPWTTVANWTDFDVAISPDGRQIAYNCRHENIVSLCVRALDSLGAHPVIEARDADEWFFSPDGEWLAVVDAFGVSKVPVRGGEPQVLHRWASLELRGSGFSWTAPDHMLFDTTTGIQRLSASGGTPEQITTLDEGGDIAGHWYPRPLSGDGQRLVVTLRHRDGTESAGIVTLADRSVQDLGIRGSGFVHIAGWLVFKQATTILAVPFDATNLRAAGNPIPMVENVRSLPRVARDGTLVYVPSRGDSKARLVWVDRQGRATPVPDERRDYSHLDLAADDRRALLNMEGGVIDLVDLERGTRKRLAEGSFPIWTHNDERVAYGFRGGLWSISANGSGAPEPLLASGALVVPTSWNSVTGDLAYYDHRAFEVMVRTPGGESRRVIAGAGRKRSARFSPDGKWIAYVSDETGEYQVYATAYPDSGRVVAVSSTGGLSPIWSSDGRELFFRRGSRVMRARVSSTMPLRFDTAVELFDGPYTLDLMGHQREDVTSNGQSFLMVENSDDFPIVVVQNWVRELASAGRK